MKHYVLKTPGKSYMLNKAIGVFDIKEAKKFKSKEEAEEYLQEIRNQAKFMKDFECEVLEITEGGE